MFRNEQIEKVNLEKKLVEKENKISNLREYILNLAKGLVCTTCWWPMLETKLVGDKFETLTNSAFLDQNFWLLTFKNCHQIDVINIDLAKITFEIQEGQQ